jgi:hypothetical protein
MIIEEIERNAIFFGKSDTTKTKFGATLYRHGEKEMAETIGQNGKEGSA